jgi:hypothetical protein
MLNRTTAIAWNVRSSSGAKLAVTIVTPKLGETPPTGFAQCSLAVPNKLGLKLRAAISALRIRGVTLSGPVADPIRSTAGLDQDWLWKPTGEHHQKSSHLELQHLMTPEKYEASQQSRGLSKLMGPEEWASYKRASERPWILYYSPD